MLSSQVSGVCQACVTSSSPHCFMNGASRVMRSFGAECIAGLLLSLCFLGGRQDVHTLKGSTCWQILLSASCC